MAISNINNTNAPQAPRSISATGPSPAVSRERSYGEEQPAAIVTLSPQARRLSMEQQQPLVTREPVQPRNNLPEAPPRTIPDTRKAQDVAVTHTDLAAATQNANSAREAAEAPARRSSEQQAVERKRINTYA